MDKSIHKYTETIKQVTGTRLDKYSAINEIEHVLEKRFANSIQDALNIDDIYVTLSQLNEIETQDIDRKVQEIISKMP
jgi:hypothetical protein